MIGITAGVFYKKVFRLGLINNNKLWIFDYKKFLINIQLSTFKYQHYQYSVQFTIILLRPEENYSLLILIKGIIFHKKNTSQKIPMPDYVKWGYKQLRSIGYTLNRRKRKKIFFLFTIESPTLLCSLVSKEFRKFI